MGKSGSVQGTASVVNGAVVFMSFGSSFEVRGSLARVLVDSVATWPVVLLFR